jgi:hypothetical protein
MSITSAKRVHVLDFGSLIKNPMYIGKVHLAVGGRLSTRIASILYKNNNFSCLSYFTAFVNA